MLNCSTVDWLATDIVDDGRLEIAPIALPMSVILVGCLLAFFGRHVYRTTIVVCGSLAAGVVAFVLTTPAVPSCEARIAIAGGALLVAALVLGLVARAAVAVVGGVCLGGLAHFVYGALPLSLDAPSSWSVSFLGRGGAYWITLAGAGVLGATLACVQRKRAVVVMTSMSGGLLVGMGVALAVDDKSITPWAWIGVSASVGLVGGLVQTRAWRRLSRARHSVGSIATSES